MRESKKDRIARQNLTYASLFEEKSKEIDKMYIALVQRDVNNAYYNHYQRESITI